MTNLRTAAQQALEACEQRLPLKGQAAIIDELNNLRAALAQQAEPDHETRAELAEQQVVQLAEERDHYRNLWQKAQQTEPAQEPAFHGFMSDDGTQVDVCFSPSAPRRDGTYATAYYTAPPQQADPTDPGHDVDVLREHVRHLERRVRELHAQKPEPVEDPVAWLAPRIVDSYSRPDLGYETCSKSDYGAFPAYTAPPQRTMVPLTAQELDGVIERHVGGSEITDDMYTSMEQFARAVEKAVWEKNHG